MIDGVLKRLENSKAIGAAFICQTVRSPLQTGWCCHRLLICDQKLCFFKWSLLI